MQFAMLSSVRGGCSTTGLDGMARSARDGVAQGLKLPDVLPEELKELWRARVGEGHSGPVVAGNDIWVFVRQGGEEITMRLSTTDGRIMWREAYRAYYKPTPVASPHGRGPFATPTVSAGKLYTFGISGVLSCLEIQNGKVLWRRDFAKNPEYGAANSPLIDGNLCILAVGSSNDGAVVAL